MVLVRRQRNNVTAAKTVETVGILRGARATQLGLGVNESGLGLAMYRNFFVRVLGRAGARWHSGVGADRNVRAPGGRDVAVRGRNLERTSGMGRVMTE